MFCACSLPPSGGLGKNLSFSHPPLWKQLMAMVYPLAVDFAPCADAKSELSAIANFANVTFRNTHEQNYYDYVKSSFWYMA